jgi:hypothetical protein
MILYFDNLITNIPLAPGIYTDLDEIRDSCGSYSTKDKYDITLYTLASYAEIDWDGVVIVYEFEKDMAHKRGEFEAFVKKLWPRAHIFYGRSDSQKKFQDKMSFINKLNGDLVFYAGNNDHPFISPDKSTFEACVKEAEKMCKKHKYVSVLYSHFLEGYRLGNKEGPYWKHMVLRPKIIKETDKYFTLSLKEAWGHSIQIFNKNLLNHFIFSENLGDGTFRRIESLWKHEKMKTKRVNQIMIVPKNPICEHFDGYSHTKNAEFPISTDYFPPLFIPQGFFQGKIKIRYGYSDYKEGWVNINPLGNKYRFQSKNGTDMKISIGMIPLFWKERISKIDINKNIDKRALKNAIREIEFQKRTPREPIEDKGLKYRLKTRLVSGNYLPYVLMRFLRANKTVSKMRSKVFFRLRKEFVNTTEGCAERENDALAKEGCTR